MIKPALTAALVALAIVFVPAPAHAAKADRAALRDQVRALLDAYRTQRATLQDQVIAASKAYEDGIQTALQLTDEQLELLEEQLDAASELAEERYEALDAADQTLATYRAILLEELKKVTDAATADAGIRATLDTLSATYAEAILPLKMQLSTLRADYRAQIKALIQAAK